MEKNSKFVTLSREEFENILPNGSWEEAEVPHVKELVYDINTENPNVDVRIYSTVDMRTNQTREIGTDAIRIVYWDSKNQRPLGKGKKILRVEGKTTIQQRIQGRILEFLAGAENQEVVDFTYVEAVLLCNSRSSFATSLLEQLHEKKFLTDNQLAYVLGDTTPKGYPTFEANAKKRGDILEQAYAGLLDSEDEEEVGNGTDQTHTETPQKERLSDKIRAAQTERREEGTPDSQGDQNIQRVGVEVISGDEHVGIVPTSAHKPYQYPFENFNIAQSLVFPYAGDDLNEVLAFNTSAGKTICAELAMDHVLAKGQKVVYSSPLKSLTEEKKQEWTKRYPDKKLVIMTGDYTLNEKTKNDLATADIITLTSEMLDSRTRKMESEQNYWLHEVGLVVVDEAHILTTERGHAVEVGIMRFTKLNPQTRIILLSATMPNVAELGEWLYTLNHKKTMVIQSSWRPVKLDVHFHEYAVLYRDYWGTQRNKVNAVLAIAESRIAEGQSTLIFVHDKGTGRRLVHDLEAKGIPAKFHSADLKLEERLEIENEFRGREAKVLVSTSTLAWGAVHCNTPITMANGTTKLAKDVKIGDSILSRNDETGELEHDIVVNKQPYHSVAEMHLKHNNGAKLIVDINHPIYISNSPHGTGTCAAKYIKPNRFEFTKASRYKTKDQHIDITTEKNHNFFANGILVHNCNLPARAVVITGIHRGINEVDELDIIQEIGRCGRYGLDDKGDAYMVIPEGETSRWEYTIKNPRPVDSVLQDHEVLAFHVLAEIENREVTGRHSLLGWYSRSLAAHQRKLPFENKDADGLLEDLENMEMIVNNGGIPKITGLGKVSAWLYYSPYDIRAWYDNFSQAFQLGMDDELLAWALGTIPSNDPGFIPKDLKDQASEWVWRLRNRGVTKCTNAITSVMAAHAAITNYEVKGMLEALRRNIVYDIQRIGQACKLIDSQFAQWNQRDLWDVLDARVRYGIPAEMAELTRVKGIGGARARKLWDAGIKSPADIAENKNWKALLKIFRNDFAQQIRAEALKIINK